ncbi:MAG: MarC family protein [Bacteroidia bacterium]
MLDFNQIASAFIVLFAVIDVIGAVPLIISIKEKTGDIKAGIATIVTALIMISFLFLGESILKFIGVDVNSFAVAGSIIMAFIAFEMILGIELFKEDAADTATASIVPVAFPLLAGAGSLTTILSIRAEYETLNIIVAIIINMLAIYVVLRSLKFVERILGPTGIRVLKKVFGIILLAISVKLFSENALSLFN